MKTSELRSLSIFAELEVNKAFEFTTRIPQSILAMYEYRISGNSIDAVRKLAYFVTAFLVVGRSGQSAKSSYGRLATGTRTESA